MQWEAKHKAKTQKGTRTETICVYSAAACMDEPRSCIFCPCITLLKIESTGLRAKLSLFRSPTGLLNLKQGLGRRSLRNPFDFHSGKSPDHLCNFKQYDKTIPFTDPLTTNKSLHFLLSSQRRWSCTFPFILPHHHFPAFITLFLYFFCCQS